MLLCSATHCELLPTELKDVTQQFYGPTEDIASPGFIHLRTFPMGSFDLTMKNRGKEKIDCSGHSAH